MKIQMFTKSPSSLLFGSMNYWNLSPRVWPFTINPPAIALRSNEGRVERASTSIPLNIAEGNGKYTAPDRCRFFDIARGSALECSACLDVLVAKKKLQQAVQGKMILIRVVSMLVGLIRSTSSSRVDEESSGYRTQRTESVDYD